MKATAKGSQTLKTWLETGRGEILGVKLRVERERSPKKCFNCNKYGHVKAECTSKQRCRKCGEEGHLAAECGANPAELMSKCGYCFAGDHTTKECQSKRDDVRNERKNFKEKRELGVPNIWKEKAEARKKEHMQESKDLDNIVEEMRQDFKRQLQEHQEQVQEQMKVYVQELMMKVVKEALAEQQKQNALMLRQVLAEQQKQNMEMFKGMLDNKTTDHPLKRKGSGFATPTNRRGAKNPATQLAREAKSLEKELNEVEDEDMAGPTTEEGEGKGGGNVEGSNAGARTRARAASGTKNK